MEESVFFAEQGLTSTSANHVCNLAKEDYRSTEAELENICFYTTDIKLLGSNDSTRIKNGVNSSYLDTITSKLNAIAEDKSLIAWLREAIKKREQMLNELQVMEVEDYCALKGIKVPERPTLHQSLSEDDYYNSLSIKEKNRYLQLETESAVYGKFIHEDGAFSNAKKDLIDKIQKPNTVKGMGRDTIIESYTPTVALTNVENQLFSLQQQQRERQAELNAIKFRCETAVKQSQIESNAQYSKECSEYSNTMNQLNADFKLYRSEESDRIGKLKIVIPDKLKNTYDRICQLGK